MEEFIKPELHLALKHLEMLKADSKPLWGSMNAQQMVEHLTEVFVIAIGEKKVELAIPADVVPKAQAFILSEHPLPRDFKAYFVEDNPALRSEELEEAIDAFADAWLRYEEYFEENKNVTTLHPYFGELTYEQWQRMNSKHLTHHLQQFGIVINNGLADE